jgi:hypothetical protein
VAGQTLPPLTKSRAEAVSQELRAGTDAGVRSAVAIPPGQQLAVSASARLAQLAPITFDLSTVKRLDGTHETVVGTLARPPAGQPATWLFTFVADAGEWKILNADPSR